MIVTLFVGILISLLSGMLGLAPTYTLPSSITTLGTTLGTSLSTVNGVFPVVTMGLCLAIIAGARLFIFGWGVLVFIYDRFPLKFT